MTSIGLQGKRSDTFFEHGNGQGILLGGHVPGSPVTIVGLKPAKDLTMMKLLREADVVLGMIWLQPILLLIDWRTAKICVLGCVSTSLIFGEWLQATVKAWTLKVLSSKEYLNELKNESIRASSSIIQTLQIWMVKRMTGSCGQFCP